ncbi:MAG: putative bifunctional diguanylate cyclase/phosphodiesterase [Gaiellaceae bacterium]
MLCLALLAYLLLLVVRPAVRDSLVLNGWGGASFELVVSVLVLVRGVTKRRDRIVPLALGTGMLMWAFGDFVLSYESRHGATPASPSLADLFYLLFFPLAYLALVVMVRRDALRLVPALWLDGAIAGVGAAALCAAFAFRGIEHTAGGSTAAVVTNLAYPLGDVLLLVLVVAGTVLLSGRRRSAWYLVAAGCAVNATGDTFNLFHGAGAPALGSIVDAVAWPSSLLLISIAVWLPQSAVDPLAGARTPGFLLPGAGALSALVVLLLGSLTGVSPSAIALATGTLVVTGIRLALTLGSLRSLTAERQQQAITDQLTGLGNRRRLDQVLTRFFSPGSSALRPELAFLFVDLDHFKEVNDSFGHAAGDQLLRQIGPRIRSCLSEGDLLARIGGDELVIVLFNGGEARAASIAGRVSEAIREPFVLEMVTVRIGVSIGIALAGSHASDPAGLMRCADQAMYRAKESGQWYAVYDPEIDTELDRLRLVDDLRSAIENQELELHYQPQIDLGSGAVVAVEALLRWPHPRLGFVPPLDFLPLAEEAGLMRPLTGFVLQEALAQCADWRSQGHNLTMSINVSATNVLDVDFVTLVEGELRRHHLPADALILEITETTLISDLDRCGKVIDELRTLGCTVSIDYFGAGFTSIASLAKLAVGEVKLDRSFLTTLDQDTNSRALIEATINLAHALGLQVVAEGVEGSAALDTLTSLGCDLAQGYYIARPAAADELRLAPHLVA